MTVDQRSPASIASAEWEPDGDHALRPFDSAEAAKRRHAELIDPSQSSVVQDASQEAADQKTIGHSGEHHG